MLEHNQMRGISSILKNDVIMQYTKFVFLEHYLWEGPAQTTDNGSCETERKTDRIELRRLVCEHEEASWYEQYNKHERTFLQKNHNIKSSRTQTQGKTICEL